MITFRKGFHSFCDETRNKYNIIRMPSVHLLNIPLSHCCSLFMFIVCNIFIYLFLLVSFLSLNLKWMLFFFVYTIRALPFIVALLFVLISATILFSWSCYCCCWCCFCLFLVFGMFLCDKKVSWISNGSMYVIKILYVGKMGPVQYTTCHFN